MTAILLWQPGPAVRAGVVAACAIVSLLVGYAHLRTGLAYEFHVFFILPILVASWYAGPRIGYALAGLVSGLWCFADFLLAGSQAMALPLAFNTIMRLAIFVLGARLIGEVRRVLLRESMMAREDTLTRLPNRRDFYERGRQAFSQAQRQGAPFTAVFIDLDRFKEVNDSFGHSVGDQLLSAVAAILRTHLRASDIPGRLGGDEFAVLLPNMDGLASGVYVESMRQRLLEAMRQHGWPVTFSIGVASYAVTPKDFDALLKQADALMYEVKQGGRDRILQQTFESGVA